MSRLDLSVGLQFLFEIRICVKINVFYYLISIGKVIKVDGCYVAVKFFPKYSREKEKEIKEKDFNTSDFKDPIAEEPMLLLADCRLLRRDEVQVLTIYHST